jgi:hypothetical protein
MRSQVSAGPIVQSMKKQGPPPWGMKKVGWRTLEFRWLKMAV